jgi:1-acyl-sn-glycerol-3-phosphate acyltransferase
VSPVPFWFLELSRPAIRGMARALFRIEFHGVDHVPPSGPVLLTPNHVSYLDPILVTIPIHRALHYMALEPFFRVPGLGGLMRWCRAFPVREGEADGPAVRAAVRLLRGGEPLVIFPEGGRSADGRLRAFHPGAFRLAAATGTPIVPVSIAGAFEVWPASRRMPRPGRIAITYHPPVTGAELGAIADRKARPDRLAEIVRDRIQSGLPR